MELKEYLEKAKSKKGLSSDRQLAKVIGIANTAIYTFFAGKNLPADDTMLKIADCADIPAEKALVDLAIWRNKKNAKVVKAWQKVQAKVAL